MPITGLRIVDAAFRQEESALSPGEANSQPNSIRVFNSSMDKQKIPRARKPKDSGKPSANSWTTPEQVEFLSDRWKAYKAIHDSNKPCYTAFWAQLKEAWFKAYPEIGTLFPNIDSVEALDDNQLERLKSAMLVRIDQLKRWYQWRASTESRIGGRHGRLALKALAPVEDTKPVIPSRALKPAEMYTKSGQYMDKVRPRQEELIKEMMEANGGMMPRGGYLNCIKRAAAEVYAEESDEVKEEIANKIMEETKRRRDNEKISDDVPRTPRQYLHSIATLGDVLAAQLHLLAKQSGWSFSVLMGGPQPNSNGTISVASYHVGRTPAPLNTSFDLTADFNSVYMEPYTTFLEDVYPMSVRKARTIVPGDDEEDDLDEDEGKKGDEDGGNTLVNAQYTIPRLASPPLLPPSQAGSESQNVKPTVTSTGNKFNGCGTVPTAPPAQTTSIGAAMTGQQSIGTDGQQGAIVGNEGSGDHPHIDNAASHSGAQHDLREPMFENNYHPTQNLTPNTDSFNAGVADSQPNLSTGMQWDHNSTLNSSSRVGDPFHHHEEYTPPSQLMLPPVRNRDESLEPFTQEFNGLLETMTPDQIAFLHQHGQLPSTQQAHFQPSGDRAPRPEIPSELTETAARLPPLEPSRDTMPSDAQDRRSSGRQGKPSKRNELLNQIGNNGRTVSAPVKELIPPLDGPPSWVLLAKAHFLTRDLGDDWKTCVDSWDHLEATSGYSDGKSALPEVSFRPEEWKKWAAKSRQGVRRYELTPFIADSAELGIAIRKWWHEMQPDFRKSDGAMPTPVYVTSDGSVWDPLRKSGPNGLVSLMTLLVWWGQSLLDRSQFQEDSSAEWKEMVIDVRECFRAIADTTVMSKKRKFAGKENSSKRMLLG